MEFRRAVYEDIESIMFIINQGKEYLKNRGINQWQNGYPNDKVIQKDIDENTAYVLTEDENILATVSIGFNGEPNYEKIKGNWLSTGDFCVIHRLGVANKCKGTGVGLSLLKYIENICKQKNIKNMKVDTHAENTSMRRFLEKNGFVYCGLVYTMYNQERVAYEKRI
ncbi:MAG: GNAT family N-acetyltransferase [Defluviitaleaceae bacterium]|nr:GNAT family N-acetyltransferase [Defluviitaleaceae bacterium]